MGCTRGGTHQHTVELAALACASWTAVNLGWGCVVLFTNSQVPQHRWKGSTWLKTQHRMLRLLMGLDYPLGYSKGLHTRYLKMVQMAGVGDNLFNPNGRCVWRQRCCIEGQPPLVSRHAFVRSRLVMYSGPSHLQSYAGRPNSVLAAVVRTSVHSCATRPCLPCLPITNLADPWAEA